MSIPHDTKATLTQISQGLYVENNSAISQDSIEARAARVTKTPYAEYVIKSGVQQNIKAIDAQRVDGVWIVLIQEGPNYLDWILMGPNGEIARLNGNDAKPGVPDRYVGWDVAAKALMFSSFFDSRVGFWNYADNPSTFVDVRAEWMTYFHSQGGMLLPMPELPKLGGE